MHVCKAEGGILALASLLLHLVALLDDNLWFSAGYASASPPASNHLELKFKERGR